MKKKLLLAVCALVFGTLHVAAQCPDYTSNILHAYTFNNSPNDHLGGSPFDTPAYVTGVTGQALSCDNTSKTATISNLPLGNNARTVAMWINRHAHGGQKVVFRYGSFTGAGVFGAYFDAYGNLIFQSGNQDFVIYDNFNINNNQWYHLAVVYDTQTLYFFVNGLPVGTEIKALNTLNSAFTLGGGSGSNISYDDVRIYDRALQYCDIQGLYNNPEQNISATWTISTSAIPVVAGTVTGGGTHDGGATVTLTATPNNPSYQFVRWTEWTEYGDEVSTNNPYTFTASSNRTLVANFSLITHTITTSASPVAGGTVTGSGGYHHGTDATLTATSNAGYDFVRWTENGNEVSTDNPYTFTVTEDRALVAEFGACAGQDYSSNLLHAYTFNNVSTNHLGGSAFSNPAYVSGVTDRALSCNNSQKSATIGNLPLGSSARTVAMWINPATPPGVASLFRYGAFSGAGVFGAYFYGTELLFQSGGSNHHINYFGINSWYHVAITYDGTTVSFYVNGANAGSIPLALNTQNSVFTLGENSGLNIAFDDVRIYDRALSACDIKGLYDNPEQGIAIARTINTSANPIAGGTVTGGGTYNDGATVTLTATPNAGYQFVRWTESGNEVSTDNPYVFTANTNRTLVAQFNLISHAITTSASPSVGGTVTGGGIYFDDYTVTLTAMPNTGYEFVRWTENGNEVSTDNPYVFTANSDRTLVAEFSPTAGINVVNEVLSGVYPNPANTVLNVVTKNISTPINVLIVNVLGETVISTSLNKQNNSIDVSNLTKGVYFVQSDNTIVKFIKD